MKTDVSRKDIIVEINGRPYDENELANVAILYEDGNMRIIIETIEQAPEESPEEQTLKTIPEKATEDTDTELPKMNEPYEALETALLPEEDLAQLRAMSNLRMLYRDENMIINKHTVDLDTKTYDIKQHGSVAEAITELAIKENTFFTQGSIHIKDIKPPTIVFKDGGRFFKIIETLAIGESNEEKQT